MTGKDSADTFKPRVIPKQPRAEYLPEWEAIARVAGSFTALVFLGTYCVIAFYALWLPNILYRGRFSLRPSKALLFPGLVVADALASVLWSIHPDVTARAAVQYFSFIACTVIAARIVPFAGFVRGLAVGASVTLIAAIIFAGGLPDDGSAFTGTLGSKNQVGSAAEVGAYCALASWFLLRGLAAKITFAGLPFLLCMVCMLLARSATSLVSLIATGSVVCAVYALGKLPPKVKRPALLFALFCIFAIAAIGSSLDWQAAGLTAVGKDVTLTGRTFLWSEGLKTGAENPFFGVGFASFWVPGNLEAEKLWFKFQITGRSGFHFHNLFVNLFVELGLVGCAIWAWMYFATFARVINWLLRDGNRAEPLFYVGIVFMYIVRAFTEVDMTGPYAHQPFVLFFAIVRIWSQGKASAKRRGQSTPINIGGPKTRH
jgi:exopolysaccharide production protein ExoQ